MAGESGGSGRVGGVVLAAGRSERMGRPKPALDVGGRSFLETVVLSLREGGCRPVVAVVAGAGTAQASEAARTDGAEIVANDAPRSEQIDSLRLGLRSLPETAGAAVVLPVDHPLVRPTTVAALILMHRDRPDAIVRAVHSGRPGHPTLFPRGTWPRLFDDALPRGARSVVDDPDVELVDVEVDDPGVIADIDTPEAYDRWIGH